MVAGAPAVAFGQTCSPGFFSSTGSVPCTAAGIGYYVPGSGATAETPASPGSYVSSTGQSAPTPAGIGYYVAGTAASGETPASPGSYVSATGQSAPTPAGIGFFVSGTAASGETPASPGYFVPTTGQSAPTAARLGYYVAGTAASGQTAASPGYFVPATGQSAPTAASIGSYVPGTAAASALTAGLGHFVATAGQSAETQATAGTYVPLAGSAFARPDPIATFTSVGAAEPLACPTGATCTNGIISAAALSTAEGALGGSALSRTLSPIAVGQVGVTTLTVDNLLNGVSGTATPQNLTISSLALTVGSPFSLILPPSAYAFGVGSVLDPGGSFDVGVLFDPSGVGSYSTVLTIDTTLTGGGAGPSLSLTVNGSASNAVPEPPSLAALLFGLFATIFARRRKRQTG